MSTVPEDPDLYQKIMNSEHSSCLPAHAKLKLKTGTRELDKYCEIKTSNKTSGLACAPQQQQQPT
jgi:hypothetical protein